MPHLAAWQKKHSPKGFILIGFYSAKSETKEEIIAFCKANKIDYPIYSRGSISGVEFSGIPHVALFDHKGKLIYAGHPGKADADLEAAMKNAPDPLIGDGPFKKLANLLPKIKDRKNLGQVLNTIKTKHLNSENEEERIEAEKLLAKLTRYGTRMMEKAEKKRETEPLNCYNLYQQTAALFKGDEIGDNAQKIVDELKNDKAFQDNVKADKELEAMLPDIDKLKSCNKCAAYKTDCESCQKKNPSLQVLIPKAKNLIRKYPSSPAAAKIKELLPLE